MKIFGFLLATASINVKLNTKMGNKNLGPVADGNEHPANLAPGRSCANSLIVAVLTAIPIILAALTHLQ